MIPKGIPCLHVGAFGCGKIAWYWTEQFKRPKNRQLSAHTFATQVRPSMITHIDGTPGRDHEIMTCGSCGSVIDIDKGDIWQITDDLKEFMWIMVRDASGEIFKRQIASEQTTTTGE